MKPRFRRPRGAFSRRSEREPGAPRVPDIREESRQIAARRRAERRVRRADDLVLGVRGAAFELRRRLRPVGAALLAFFGRIAPPIVGALFGAVKVIALALLGLSVRGAAFVRRLAAGMEPGGAALWRWLLAEVRPIPTYATVLGAAAVLLAISQFLNYHGVEVGSRYYEGRVGQVARAPLTDLEVTGSAHLYVLLPVALLTLALIAFTVRGRWQLGRAIAALGLLGLVISVAVDVPQGLDAGRAGSAYDSANPELLEGFWIQLCSCAVLALVGPLLGARVREREPAAGMPRRRRLRGPLRRRAGDGPSLGSPGRARA